MSTDPTDLPDVALPAPRPGGLMGLIHHGLSALFKAFVGGDIDPSTIDNAIDDLPDFGFFSE